MTMSKRKFVQCSPDQGGVASTSVGRLMKLAKTEGGFFIKSADRSKLKKLSEFKKTRDITGQTDILEETKVRSPLDEMKSLFKKAPDVSSGGRFFKLFV